MICSAPSLAPPIRHHPLARPSLQALPAILKWGLVWEEGLNLLIAVPLPEALKKLDEVWDAIHDFKVGTAAPLTVLPAPPRTGLRAEPARLSVAYPCTFPPCQFLICQSTCACSLVGAGQRQGCDAEGQPGGRRGGRGALSREQHQRGSRRAAAVQRHGGGGAGASAVHAARPARQGRQGHVSKVHRRHALSDCCGQEARRGPRRPPGSSACCAPGARRNARPKKLCIVRDGCWFAVVSVWWY